VKVYLPLDSFRIWAYFGTTRNDIFCSSFHFDIYISAAALNPHALSLKHLTLSELSRNYSQTQSGFYIYIYIYI
jgi:hypothetical protein